jgi:hypothetical protein
VCCFPTDRKRTLPDGRSRRNLRAGTSPSFLLIPILILLLAAAGCVSKKKAQAQARQAYIAAQQQPPPPFRMDPQHPVVFVQGPVQSPSVPWEDGLTLTRAITTAVYTGFMNPMVIRVFRNGQIVGDFKGIDLLHHEDMALEPGDTVLIIP